MRAQLGSQLCWNALTTLLRVSPETKVAVRSLIIDCFGLQHEMVAIDAVPSPAQVRDRQIVLGLRRLDL